MATSTKTTDDVDVIAPTPTEIAQPPFVPVTTIEDPNNGVRRILPSPDPGYRPAPVDPSDKDVERAEQRLAREEAEANGESYELPDGTVVETTPEGKAEAEAKAEEEQLKEEQKAEAAAAKEQRSASSTSKTTSSSSKS